MLPRNFAATHFAHYFFVRSIDIGHRGATDRIDHSRRRTDTKNWQIGQSRLDVEAPPLTLPTLSSRSFHFSFDFYYQLGATSAPYHLSEEQFASIGTAPPPEVIARLIRKRVVRAFQAQPNSTTQQNFSKREAMVKAANGIRL